MSSQSLKTSSAMPVENYSVVTQSENGTQFSPGMKTVFRVPSHLSYVDFHTSYLFFDFEVKNEVTKLEFSNGGVPEMLLRTWRVLIGGHVVEEIDHPNVLIKTLKYDYGQDLGMRELSNVFNKSGRATAYQGFNGQGAGNDGKCSVAVPPVDATTNICDKVKITLDLAFSGIFGSSQTFPVGMTGDVTIEIIWEQANKVLKCLESAIVPHTLSDATHQRLVDGVQCEDLVGGGGALASIDFKASDYPGALPNTFDITNIKDCPFVIGNRVELSGRNSVSNAQYGDPDNAGGGLTKKFSGNITDITQPGGAGTALRLVVTVADPTNTITNVRATIPQHDSLQDGQAVTLDNNGALTYEISVPTLALQVVVPPAQYVQAQAEKINREGLAIDVPTYTCYKSNTYAGIKSSTIDIPCFSSRARSILAIGVRQQSLGGANLRKGYCADGDYNDLQQYQFQIGEEREPVRPVDCSNLSTWQHNVAQEQLTELDKALKSGGCDVRSLRKYRDNFIIGRALSSYGGSIPLTMKGARIYIDYLETSKRPNASAPTGQAVAITNKNWFVYVHHIRRMIVTGQGVQVMY